MDVPSLDLIRALRGATRWGEARVVRFIEAHTDEARDYQLATRCTRKRAYIELAKAELEVTCS